MPGVGGGEATRGLILIVVAQPQPLPRCPPRGLHAKQNAFTCHALAPTPTPGKDDPSHWGNRQELGTNRFNSLFCCGLPVCTQACCFRYIYITETLACQKMPVDSSRGFCAGDFILLPQGNRSRRTTFLLWSLSVFYVVSSSQASSFTVSSSISVLCCGLHCRPVV